MNTSSATLHTSDAAPGRFGGWFGRAKRSIDALPIHLPVHLGSAGTTQTKAAPMRVLGFDQALVWVTIALLAWGMVMVYSASIALPDINFFPFIDFSIGNHYLISISCSTRSCFSFESKITNVIHQYFCANDIFIVQPLHWSSKVCKCSCIYFSTWTTVKF